MQREDGRQRLAPEGKKKSSREQETLVLTKKSWKIAGRRIKGGKQSSSEKGNQGGTLFKGKSWDH